MVHMPFDVAHALLRLAWHESWSAALSALPQGPLATALEERRQSHEDLANEARETWNVQVTRRSKESQGKLRRDFFFGHIFLEVSLGVSEHFLDLPPLDVSLDVVEVVVKSIILLQEGQKHKIDFTKSLMFGFVYWCRVVPHQSLFG